MICPGLLASVNQILNFTNKAYYFINNVTSISEATFQSEYFRWFTKKKLLEDIDGFTQFVEFEDLKKNSLE